MSRFVIFLAAATILLLYAANFYTNFIYFQQIRQDIERMETALIWQIEVTCEKPVMVECKCEL